MALGFKSVLAAFRVLQSYPDPGGPKNSFNGDAACDPYGALYVRLVTGGNPGPGNSEAFGKSLTFNSHNSGFQEAFTAFSADEFPSSTWALQYVHAHSTEACYLQVHTDNPPLENNAALFEWPVPYPEGLFRTYNAPWGLRGTSQLVFGFSATPHLWTPGPKGVVHGVLTYGP